MKKMIYCACLLAFTAMACNNSGKSIKPVSENPLLTFSVKEYEKKSQLNGFTETELKAEIPVANGETEAAKRINDRVFQITKLIVGQENDRSANYEELFSGFIKNYEDFIKENPDHPGGWEATVKGSVPYQTPELLNIKIDSYMMTGGAHGNGNQTSLIFDPRDGKELNIGDIVNDTNVLSRIAERKFREKYNIPAESSINSTGLMFNNDKFALPANIFLTGNGLLLFYNAYEIAAYVDGTREILIPYNEISDYLSVPIK